MVALNNTHNEFPYEEVKELYTENKDYFEDSDYPFDDFLKNHDKHVWAFLDDDNRFIGYIYLHTVSKDSCYLSGNAIRKVADLVNEAISGTCGFYFANYPQLEKIYADTDYQWAMFALRGAGFKRISKSKFILERNSNGK